MLFRTRIHGKQKGQKFPILERKKLPAKISIKHSPNVPTFRNKESGITCLEYKPPTVDKEGEISFRFCGKPVQSKIRMVDKERNVGQWSVTDPTVFVDKKIGIGFIRFLSLHEALESYLQKKLGINWQPYGHLLAEAMEHREFLKGHLESEWKLYDKQVRQVAHMNIAGSKMGGARNELKKAFEILAENRAQHASENGRDFNALRAGTTT